MKWPIIISLLINFSAMASVPSVESLFRNGNNRDITGTSAYLNYEISLKENEEIFVSKDDSPAKKYYIRLYFINFADDRPGILQLVYNNVSMKNDSLVKVAYYKNLLRSLGKQHFSQDSELYFSVFYSLIANKSELVDKFLKKYSTEYRSNDQIINKDKYSLYKKYIEYLKQKKESPDIELPSPLKPENEDEKEKVKEILSKPMYRPTNNIKLVKENTLFYWLIKLDVLNAKFTNENHRLVDVAFKNGESFTQLNFSKYVLFDGIHELPKSIIFRSSNGKVFELRVLKVQHYNHTSSWAKKRLKEYRKKEKELAFNDDEFPEFLLF